MTPEDADPVRCPVCGFRQDEFCVITEDGPNYACERPGCRVSTFYGGDQA